MTDPAASKEGGVAASPAEIRREVETQIVRWLRSEAIEYREIRKRVWPNGPPHEKAAALDEAADLIEEGEHRS